MPEVFRTRLLDMAVEPTLSEIVRHAKGRLQSNPSIESRSLYNALAYTLNRNSGRGRAGISNVTTTINIGGGRRVRVKGIVVPGRGGSALTSQGAKLVKPSRYGPKVEFGTKHMKREPFMVPAVQSQERPIVDRSRAAGREAEKDLAAIGMRNL